MALLIPSGRENFLETKISMLDKRLTLVEKFVELRFKEAFHKFLDGDTGSSSHDNDDGRFNISFGENVSKKKKGQQSSEVEKDMVDTNLRKRKSRKQSLAKDFGSLNNNCSTTEPADLLKSPGRGPAKKRRYNTRRGKGSKVDGTVTNTNAGVVVKAEQDPSLVDQNQESFTGEDIESDGYLQFPESEANVVENETIQTRESISSEHNEISEDELITADSPKKVVRVQIKTGAKGDKFEKKLSNRKSKKRESLSKTTADADISNKEDSPPKKRVYAPALCSTLPSIARADPTRKECQLCHMHIKNELYEAHMQSHVKERHLKCPFCEKTYFNQSMLRKHRMVHQPEKYGKKCRICEKLFFQGDKKLAHERFCVKRAIERKDHVDPEIIQDLKNRSPGWKVEEDPMVRKDSLQLKECPHCNKMFKPSFYDRHLKVHTQTKDWACKLCDKAYFHKHDLVRHFAAEHRSPICDLCSKSFENKTDLINHVVECRKQQNKLKSEGATISLRLQNEVNETLASTSQSETIPILTSIGKLESTPTFIEDGSTVTILGEDIIVVTSDVEVGQLEAQPNSIMLVDDK